MIDADKIIADTRQVFNHINLSQMATVSEYDYTSIHPSPLTPTNIKIDCNLFLSEIRRYSDHFYQWGTEHTQLPRYGLALVNQDGVLKNNDPINGSLYEWNKKHTDSPLLETDCLTSTPVMSMESLKPLSVLKNHWCRSNVLHWEESAMFFPHVDTVVPSPWIRLWATTDPTTINICFWNKNTCNMESVTGIESGRIYIIDTSLVHDAHATGSNYQLFLSVLPNAVDIIRNLI
jgi:hypothetical protein